MAFFINTYAVFNDYIQTATDNPFLGSKYGQFIIIMVAFYIIAWFFVMFGKSFLKKLTAKTKTQADDIVIDLIGKPIYYLILMIGLKFALIPLQLGSKAAQVTANVNNSLIIISIAYMAMVFTDVICTILAETWAKKTKSTIDDQLIPVVRRFAKAFIIIIAVLMVMSEWGIEIGPFIASLGIAGLAIGFAIKDSLANIFGGISLILDRAFKVGDPIELEDGTTGKIHDVGLRSTRVKTWNNEIVVVPNGQMANEKIKNFLQPNQQIRIVITFGVEYGTKVEKAKKVAMDAIKSVKTVSKDPEPVVRFEEMADSALMFTAYIWVDELSLKITTKEDVLTALHDDLYKARIGIPYPTRTIINKRG